MRSRNTADINRVSARCLRVVVYFLAVFYAYLLILKDYNMWILSVSFGAAVIFALIPAIMISVFKLESRKLTQHVMLWCTVIVSVILITELNYSGYPFIMFPLLLASLYYNRTFVLYASLLMSAGILASAVVQIEIPDIDMSKINVPEVNDDEDLTLF